VAHELNDLFKAVSRLDGNLGYLRVDGFTDPATAADTAAAAFNFLANTEALVVDLRYNGGGNPVMVAYLESYLFDHRVHVNDIYFRSTNSTTSYYTEDQVPGKRYLGRDVYILTSRDTISGGEGFAYEMRAEKRAESVGEVTAGGANPGQIQRIDDNFGIFVPFGRVINPVTGTNWEGVGVTPDIATSADLALKVAQLAALEKLMRDGHDRPPDLVTEMKSTADQLQKDITAARIVSNRCPEAAAPAIHAVTDANYGDHVTAVGTMIVWGTGFTAEGGNSLQFTGEGSGSATLSGTDGSYFWDASDNQINSAVNGRLTQGQWAVVVQNACGVSSAPFPIAIQ
jgi:hypothetical protein